MLSIVAKPLRPAKMAFLCTVFSICAGHSLFAKPSEDKRSGILSDPNRDNDPEYIVRLVGQVVRVSVETVTIVNGLPAEYAG